MEITLVDYYRAYVTGYMGGSTWLHLDGQTLWVPGKSPVDILRVVRGGGVVHAEKWEG